MPDGEEHREDALVVLEQAEHHGERRALSEAVIPVTRL